MPKRDHSSNSQFTHQLFHGTTWHSRLLPSVHKFTYPYRYWGVNISALAAGDGLPEVASMQLQNNHTHSAKLFNKLPFGAAISKGLPIFSAKHKALQQFYADDYLQGLPLDQANQEIADITSADDNVKSIEGLLQRLNAVFKDKTGSTPTGEIIGLIVCRNVGVYFSPVNFYIGFDSEQTPTHLLAEVSNTPWDKRHYYSFLLKGEETELCHDKDFHVSPFNPIDQLYRWLVSVKPQQSKNSKADDKTNQNDVFDIRIAINISDKRGEVLKTGIKMSGEPMTQESIRQSLKQNPLMNFTSLSRIYWHAFKLYALKKVPYINYGEKLADSKQKVSHE
ncbi:DUF1365 domain-containing protein [Psychrobacter sp. A3]|uniref:DUF1365 domain-containing protein n=1 Tax=Psychrobacter sp. A3 TaxID=2992754 RepID=UPI00237BF79C|nr:DUF1365 domain-containing protein [Psychrobacter sp. A3]MDE0491629.1 DUF1365 domain-containing protein [Psychrobacter sp. A3]